MKVLLDTNVIIAAFASRGLSADVLELCLSGHTVITSEHILSEVREKLTGKIALPATIADNVLAYLREYSILAVPLPVIDVECRDKEDLPILGAADATCGLSYNRRQGSARFRTIQRHPHRHTEAILGTPPGRPGSRMTAT